MIQVIYATTRQAYKSSSQDCASVAWHGESEEDASSKMGVNEAVKCATYRPEGQYDTGKC